MSKVAIIGAGYTGLTAAYELAKRGHEVVIYEASETIGGLASDFKVEGAHLERAYHHLFKTDTYIIDLAKELGVGDKLNWHDSSVSIYYENKIYPFVTALDLLRFKPLSFLNRLRLGATVFYLQRTNNWQRFQQVSAYDWMRKTAGKQANKVIWEPLLKGKFDRYYDKVSMAWLWARIHIRANSREKGDSGEKLGYFDGGFQTFTNALLKQLRQHKVDIQTGAFVSRIDNTRSGQVKITFADKSAQTFDACLVTAPSYVFAKLIERNKNISVKYRKQLTGIQYLGARLLIFSSKQDLSPYYWHNINDLSLPFLVFINHTKLIDKSNYGGKNVYYIGTYLPHDHSLFTCDDAELRKIWFDALRKIFPDFDEKQIHEEHFFRFANAQHIVEANYADKIPDIATPLSQVFLSNFSQIYPEDRGTNYAVREGLTSAKRILASLGDEDDSTQGTASPSANSNSLARKAFVKFKKHFFTPHFLRFLVVGTINFSLDFTIFLVLTSAAKFHVIPANIISTTTALIMSFFLNKYFVFRAKDTTRTHVFQFVFWTLFNVWVVQTTVVFLAHQVLIHLLHSTVIINGLAKLIGVGVSLILNFFCYSIIFSAKTATAALEE